MPSIALIDCNNFFASCEALMNPSLEGKAVCVLSNNDGCIVARSYEAKKMGIKMGEPYFRAKEQFPKCIFISGNHKLYCDISKRIMEIIASYSPKFESYSIDEAFIDLEGTQRMHNFSDYEIIKKIKEEIKEKVGIDVSVGLSETKTLAKFASEKAKEKSNIFEKIHPKGLYKIDKEDIEYELKNSQIEDIWGIGRRGSEKLRNYIIKTPYDFIRQNDIWIKRTMGIVGVNLKKELMGISKNPVLEGNSPPKSIQKSESFKKYLSDKNQIKAEIIRHIHKICVKLRALNLHGEILSIFLRKKDYRIDAKKIILEYPENSEFKLNLAGIKLFEEIFEENSIYRSAGVTISKLSKDDSKQLNIFQIKESEKHQKLSAVWDNLEEKFGKGIIHIGKNGIR